MNSWFKTIGFLLVLCSLAMPTAAWQSVGADRQISSDSAEEIEPALITQTRFGVEYTVAVYMRFNPNIASANSQLYASAYTSTGLSCIGAVPAHSSYTQYADPVLAQNSTNRIFLAALARNASGDNAILAWYSDNGGWTWYGPTVVDTMASGNEQLDKPVIAVAPNGRVWLAYIGASGSNTIYVQHGTLTSGVWSWSGRLDAMPGRSHADAPQIMVDSDNRPYLLWVDDELASPPTRIRLARGVADSSTVPFTGVADIAVATESLYGHKVSEFVTVQGSIQVRARTVPVAKLDTSRRRISVAWHEPNGSSYSRIRFASLVTNAGTPAWTTPTVIAAAAAHDINVGMDFNPANGAYFVTYYSFSASAYSVIGVYVQFDAWGNPSNGNSNATISSVSRMGDVSYLASSPTNVRNIGEYHDVSFTNGAFKSAQIIVYPTSDVWIFTVTP
jgi:hypothetical protein